jgi:hypothetical protein
MLTDNLNIKELKAKNTVPSPETLRKTIELLHTDDKAVLRYFGVDRQALIKNLAYYSSDAYREVAVLFRCLMKELTILSRCLSKRMTVIAKGLVFFMPVGMFI